MQRLRAALCHAKCPRVGSLQKYCKDSTPELPEEPTNCCQSGCANCVWIDYATKLTEIFNDEGEKAQKVILDKISDPSLKAFLQMEMRSIASRPKTDPS